jgi:hypothetical protein
VTDRPLNTEAANRTAILREAADAVDATPYPSGFTAGFDKGARWATALLRQMPDEAQQPKTGRRRLTPNEHSAAWHAVEGSAGEEGADAGTILRAVLERLGIDAPDEYERPVVGEQQAEREPCGEGHCRCYGTGTEHADCACGCDCPRDDDGQLIDD